MKEPLKEPSAIVAKPSTAVESNVSTQSLGDSFTGLRKTSGSPISKAQAGGSSNDSLGDSFTGLKSNVNWNAQPHEDHSFKMEIPNSSKLAPPIAPKPIVKNVPNAPVEKSAPTPSLNQTATGIVKKAMEDGIAQKIVHRTVEAGIAKDFVDKTLKNTINSSQISAQESEPQQESSPVHNIPTDSSAEDTDENPSISYKDSRTTINSSFIDEEEDGNTEREVDVIIMPSSEDDSPVDEVIEDALERAVESIKVDEVIDDVIKVTSNEALATADKALEDMLDSVTKKSSHETIGVYKMPSNSSSEEEINV